MRRGRRKVESRESRRGDGRGGGEEEGRRVRGGREEERRGGRGGGEEEERG